MTRVIANYANHMWFLTLWSHNYDEYVRYCERTIFSLYVNDIVRIWLHYCRNILSFSQYALFGESKYRITIAIGMIDL